MSLINVNGSRLIGNKVTRQKNYIEQLLQENVKVIYCYRDPRAVVYSAMNRFPEFKLYPKLNFLKNDIKRALVLQRHPQFYMLSYEFLIRADKENLTDFETFLDIQLTTDLNEFVSGVNMNYQDNSSFSDVDQLFDKKAKDRWYDEMDPRTIKIVESVLYEEMKELGYQLLHKNPELKKEYKEFRNYQFKSKLKGKIIQLLNLK